MPPFGTLNSTSQPIANHSDDYNYNIVNIINILLCTMYKLNEKRRYVNL